MDVRARLRSLTPEQRAALVASLSPAEQRALLHWWPAWARDEQLAPHGDWRVWLVMAGRGWGKTRTGAEQVRTWARSGRVRIALVGRTHRDAREVMIEGESGLLACCMPGEVEWSPGRGILRWPRTGALATLYTADRPDQLRGPQHHYAWGDESAAWREAGGYHALDQILYGLRLGDAPRAILTTTPRVTRELRDLLARPDVVATRGRTRDNARNLAPGVVAALEARYAGTRLGRQELDGELLDDVDGALWTWAMIEAAQADVEPADLSRVVVAVDPAVTAGEGSDETGIVVVGRSPDGVCWVLDDLSGRHRVTDWPRVVAEAYARHKADAVVVEVNQGGDMVAATLRAAGARLPIREVRASRGKATRAEPVAALYAQGRVRHVRDASHRLALLEEQLATWTPGRPSPDRLDALVWGVSEITGSTQGSWSAMEIPSAARGTVPADVMGGRSPAW
jgi:predicted phage terminase large subunit-like protein